MGLAWIPFMKYISDALYVYLQSVQAYISPPIAAVFLLGVFWKRVNAKGAIVSLLAGFVLGIGRLALELSKDKLGDGFLYQYASMNFMHVAVFLTIACTGLLIVVSLLTKPESDEKLAGLTFQTTPAAGIKSAISSRVVEIVASIVLIAMVTTVWIYFRP
jgi:SSS family solute:Na+ symporter